MNTSTSTIAFVDAPAPAADIDYTGRIVKVGFDIDSAQDGINAEWMFVQVDGVKADGSFHGRLLNDPLYVLELSSGDVVSGFTAAHIYSVEPEGATSWLDTVELDDA